MRKRTTYESTFFSAEVLAEGFDAFKSQVNPEAESEFSYSLIVDFGNERWSHDTLEEFLANYRKASGWVYFRASSESPPFLEMSVTVHGVDNGRWTEVEIGGSGRSQIEAVAGVFDKYVSDCRLPMEPPRTKPTIFIGHGRSPLWRYLKDHLQDQHDFDVEAYEVGARAGHGIRDILEDMLDKSTFAILVMTGDDETTDGSFQPRLNVVHEAGLFQGRLGFRRAIVLLEEGTQGFSNINGICQIRFSKGNIREAFGDVLATLRREFPEMAG